MIDLRHYLQKRTPWKPHIRLSDYIDVNAQASDSGIILFPSSLSTKKWGPFQDLLSRVVDPDWAF
jgi:hypothetical protein